MVTTRLFLLVTIALCFGSAHAQIERPQVEVIPTQFSTAYVPVGYDDNDRVQFVVEGFFSNDCYRPAKTEVIVDQEKKSIVLKPNAYLYHGVCAQVIVNYPQVIDLGILPEGVYQLSQDGDEKSLGRVDVRRAKSSNPDDFLYAPVSQAYFEHKKAGNFVRVNGEITNSCMKLARVEVQVQPKVIVVQPIAEMQEGPNCQSGSFPFSSVVEIQQPLSSGRYLLHVRSLNAQSINHLVDVP